MDRWRPTKDSTLEEYLEWWLEEHVARRFAPMTYQTYHSALSRHIIPRFGELPVCRLDVLDVQEWIDDLEKAGYSPNSVGLYVRALSSAMKFAFGLGVVDRNVVVSAKLPRKRKQDRRALEPDEILGLREAWADEWYGPFLDTALGTGMRRSELIGLRWSSVAESEIAVNESMPMSGAIPVWASTKGIADRTVPMSKALAAILALHRVAVAAHGRRAGTRGWTEYDLVFPSRKGTPASRPGIYATLRRAAELAGVEPAPRLHELRHTYATRLIDGGVPRSQLRRLLGHQYYETTMKYVHVTSRARGTAESVIDDLLTG